METLKKIIEKQDALIELLSAPQYYEIVEAVKRKRDELTSLRSQAEQEDEQKEPIIGTDCKKVLSPEEIKHNINQILCRYYQDDDYKTDRAVNDLIELMESYHSQFSGEKVSDEAIEKWAETDKDEDMNFFDNADKIPCKDVVELIIGARIQGAKAMRDGLIK